MTPTDGFGQQNSGPTPRRGFLWWEAGRLAWGRPCCGQPSAGSSVGSAAWVLHGCLTERSSFCGPNEMDASENHFFIHPFRSPSWGLPSLALSPGFFDHHFATFGPGQPLPSPAASSTPGFWVSLLLSPACLLHDRHPLSCLSSLSLTRKLQKRKLCIKRVCPAFLETECRLEAAWVWGWGGVVEFGVIPRW